MPVIREPNIAQLFPFEIKSELAFDPKELKSELMRLFLLQTYLTRQQVELRRYGEIAYIYEMRLDITDYLDDCAAKNRLA